MDWAKLAGGGLWVIFIVSFLVIATWESIQPKSKLLVPAERRWRNHSLVYLISTVISISILRMSPVIVSLWVEGSNVGIFNAWLPAPMWLQCVISLLAWDFVKYATHRSFHSFEWLWRAHKVHHSDPDFDVSTAVRVHPIEMALIQAAMVALVAGLGLPPLGVLLAEWIGAFQSFFEHANAALPSWIEKPLSRFWMTPDLHRIHHSEDERDQQQNYGEMLTLWDRLLGTFASKTKTGNEVRLGMKGLQEAGSVDFGFLLRQPFHAELTAPEQTIQNS